MKLKSNHILGNGMELAYLMNEEAGNVLYDVIKNNNGSMVNNPSWTLQDLNVGLDLASANSQYISVPQKIDTSGGITIVFGSYVTTPNSWGTLFGGTGTHTTDDRCLAHTPHDDNVLYWDYGHGAPGEAGRITVDYSSYLSTFTNVALVSEGKGGSFKGIYLNGALAASAASSDGPDGDVYIDIGRLRSAANYYHNGILTYFYIYNRVLSSDEIRWLDMDPFGMFEADYTPKYFSDVVSGIVLPIFLYHYLQTK